MPDLSYLGKGRIFLGPKTGGALREIGNCSSLEFSVEEEKKDVLDYTTAGGGKRNSLSRITAVTMALSAYEFSPDNLALALRGTSAAVAAGAVTGQAHTAYQGGLIKFLHVPDAAIAPVITNVGATVTYVSGTDYEVVGGGIVILAGGAIANATPIVVNYTRAGSNLVQALTTSAADYRMVFVGLNEYDTGKAVVVDVHRAKFSALSGLALIADEAATIALTAEVLSDPTVTGAGLSRFFTVEAES